MKSSRYTPEKDSILSDFVARLKKKLGKNLKSAILFGSRARGEHGRDSDYDVLILVNKKSKRLELFVSEMVYYMLDTHDVVITAFVEDEAEFNNDRFEPLFINIRNEGIPFYGSRSV